ncbi:MAG: glutathione S-transferase family protein [Rhizobiaceae bacterium]
MILIGQYDSSFVRRAGIALALYGIAFEHRPWSVFGDAERIRALNPLGRVPTLVLDDGEVLVDSPSILDHIDSLVEPEARLLAPSGQARRAQLRVIALATGLTDFAVSLFYTLAIEGGVAGSFLARRRTQIDGALDALENDRAALPGPYWFGARPGHADIAVACALRHVTESLPRYFTLAARPALAAHCATLEAMPVFRTISQPFIPPT